LLQQKTTTSDIQWYLDLKRKLQSEYGIPLEDISKFAKAVNGIKQYGYDVSKVVNEFSNFEFLKLKMNTLQQDIQTLETKLASLNKQCYMTEVKVLFHNEAISNYTKLESIGFGLKELTLLWGIVNEVSEANNIPLDQVPSKFITDIEEQYDKKLGFESKLEKLQTEVNKANQALTKSRVELSMVQLVDPALAKLIQSGIKEQDIINLASIFERYSTGIARQSLISELDKYGSLKSAIQKLTEENGKLNNDITSMNKEKQELILYDQKMTSALNYLNHKMSFFQGYIQSLRNEILGLSLTATIIMYFFKSQIEDLQRTTFYYNIRDFFPLIRAENGEIDIPIQDIRKGVVKALEILLDSIKSDHNSNKLIEILSNTKSVLLQEENYN
jgi:hypothetical protein